MRVLVLAPHTDDGELGCGGTIAKLVARGEQVRYLAFSIGGARPEEVDKATELLGILPGGLTVLDFPVRDFPSCRQAILDELVKWQSGWRPDLVFLPSTFDTHQDHQTVSEEGFRAFKKTSILGYELPWNNLTFLTSAFTLLDPAHVDKKIESVQSYLSQADRPYVNPTAIRSLARVRGVQINAEYAEAFEVKRWVM